MFIYHFWICLIPVQHQCTQQYTSYHNTKSYSQRLFIAWIHVFLVEKSVRDNLLQSFPQSKFSPDGSISFAYSSIFGNFGWPEHLKLWANMPLQLYWASVWPKWLTETIWVALSKIWYFSQGWTQYLHSEIVRLDLVNCPSFLFTSWCPFLIGLTSASCLWAREVL